MSGPDKTNNRAPSDDAVPTASFGPETVGPGAQIGPYKLLSILGEGGYGIVYLAEQAHPVKRRVALKVIKPGMDSRQVIARFEAERQALALLDHPNISHVFDGGTTRTDRPYFVMEYVKGLAITEHCDRHKLNVQERLRLFVQVCEAVHHAHQKGIIHRDLKPSNILVAIDAERAIPRIIDFGVAKALSQPLTERTLVTEQGQFIGTPEYMSPEQADLTAQDIDIRSDIYSLGVVLYELLTGVLPFDPETLRAGGLENIRKVITQQEPRTPSTRLTGLGEDAAEVAQKRSTDALALAKCLYRELEWIPLKAMRKDRTRRYRSASEFADDISNYLTGSPLIAGPETATYRFRKFVQRHRVPVTAALVVMLSLLAGLLVSTVMFVRAQRALDALARLEGRVEADRVLSTTERLYAEGRYEAALGEIEVESAKQDLGPKGRLLHAQLLFETGRLADAQTMLQPLVKAEPDVAGAAHYLLARIDLRKGIPEAEEHAQLAETMRPKTAEAYSLRAMTAGTLDETLDWLAKGLRVDPTHYASRKARALLYYGLAEYQELAHEVEALIALRPKETLGYALRAIVRREAGDFAGALEDHQQAIALCESEAEAPELYYQRCETYSRMGLYEEALMDAKTCVSLQPKAFTYQFRLFTSLVALGDYTAAIRVYKGIVHGGAEWHRQFKWWAQKHVLDLLHRGRDFQLPADVVDKPPFPIMRETLECYRSLEKKAKRIVSGGFWMGSWSPDGRQVVYGPPVDHYGWLAKSPEEPLPALKALGGVKIVDVESGLTRRLASDAMMPAWSPDGQYIAFVRTSDVRSASGDICIVPVAGGKPRKLAPGTWPVWSSDPKRLYFQSDLGTGPVLCIWLDEPDAVPEKVASCEGLFWISPDQRWLVHDSGGGEVRIVDLATGSVVGKWVPPRPLYTWHLHGSPDETEICCQSGSWYGEIGLWIYDIQSREARQLIGSPARGAVWSPDGSKLVLSIRDEAWVVTVNPNEPTWDTFDLGVSCEEFTRRTLEKCNRTIAADPCHAESYLERALVYLSLDRLDDARSDLAVCGSLIEDHSDPLIWLTCWWGGVYAHSGRFLPQAEPLLLQAQRLAERFPGADLPSWWEPGPQLIRLYESLGKPQEAATWRARLAKMKATEE